MAKGYTYKKQRVEQAQKMSSLFDYLNESNRRYVSMKCPNTRKGKK